MNIIILLLIAVTIAANITLPTRAIVYLDEHYGNPETREARALEVLWYKFITLLVIGMGTEDDGDSIVVYIIRPSNPSGTVKCPYIVFRKRQGT